MSGSVWDRFWGVGGPYAGGMTGSATSGFTYAEVGGTQGVLPVGYQHLERQRLLGVGRELFERASEALMTWAVQRGAGLAVDAAAPRAIIGVDVTLRTGLGRLSVSAPCRVVYTVQQENRVGFAYGTLPGHPESGEELFLVELLDDERVQLTVRAFSRPARWFSRLATPGSRLIQRAITERYMRSLVDC
jgi:uncharacterized protein (UPF0548 family)